jgi:hypothetical protein
LSFSSSYGVGDAGVRQALNVHRIELAHALTQREACHAPRVRADTIIGATT